MSCARFYMLVTVVYFMVMVSGSGYAAVIHVPGDQPTIQAGIDAASDGDTVLVADGTYTGVGNKDLDFKGKAITVTSANGPENCIIDCEGNGRGFYFYSGEGAESVVSGFTISNGHAGEFGGGILCEDGSSPIIEDCIVANNSASNGSGISIRSSSPTIRNSTITDNSAGYGGAVHFSDGSAMIENNTIMGNDARAKGGGIFGSSGGSVTVQDNTIANNTVSGSQGAGGGVYVTDGVLIRNNSITGNSVLDNGGKGGGIYVASDTTIVQSNIIDGNSAAYWGGGIYSSGYSPIIRNNIITRNLAKDHGGGGIYLRDSSPIIVNNTITGNSANGGGGIGIERESYPMILNTILWGNSPNEIFTGGREITIIYSDIQGGWPGKGNIDVDPLFVGPDDFNLSDSSPCIGAGLMNLDAPVEDIDGNPRPNPPDSNPDIGAYENPRSSAHLPGEFPDSNLERAVRDALTKPEGSLTLIDLHSLTHLDGSDRNISDLTGLDYCTELVTLLLYSNQIIDISPLAGLNSLTLLNLAGNQTIDITPLSNLSQLVQLNLGGNRISGITPLTSMTNLELLNLGGNQVSDIGPLESLTVLNRLYLGGNQIADLQALIDNTGLGEGDLIDVRSNPLSTDALTVQIPTLQGRGATVMYDQPPTGDVNRDGSVTATDAALVLKHLVGLVPLDVSQTQAGDLSGDGALSACDAALILRQAKVSVQIP